MNDEKNYHINLDIKFSGLVAAAKEEWSNQTLCEANDCFVRLAVLYGEFQPR